MTYEFQSSRANASTSGFFPDFSKKGMESWCHARREDDSPTKRTVTSQRTCSLAMSDCWKISESPQQFTRSGGHYSNLRSIQFFVSVVKTFVPSSWLMQIKINTTAEPYNENRNNSINCACRKC